MSAAWTIHTVDKSHCSSWRLKSIRSFTRITAFRAIDPRRGEDGLCGQRIAIKPPFCAQPVDLAVELQRAARPNIIELGNVTTVGKPRAPPQSASQMTVPDMSVLDVARVGPGDSFWHPSPISMRTTVRARPHDRTAQGLHPSWRGAQGDADEKSGNVWCLAFALSHGGVAVADEATDRCRHASAHLEVEIQLKATVASPLLLSSCSKTFLNVSVSRVVSAAETLAKSAIWKDDGKLASV